MPLLVCMMGLPRSGKSTVTAELVAAHGWPVVNRDSIRLALHGQRFVARAEPTVKAMAKCMVDALFAYHGTIIVDETNLNQATRNFWAKGLHRTQFLRVNTPYELCIARAKAAKDKEIEDVINKMHEYTEELTDEEARYDVHNAQVTRVLAAATTA